SYYLSDDPADPEPDATFTLVGVASGFVSPDTDGSWISGPIHIDQASVSLKSPFVPQWEEGRFDVWATCLRNNSHDYYPYQNTLFNYDDFLVTVTEPAPTSQPVASS